MLDACLMVHGPWLKAHGSWPREARGGSWLIARGHPDPGDPGAGPRSGSGPAWKAGDPTLEVWKAGDLTSGINGVQWGPK